MTLSDTTIFVDENRGLADVPLELDQPSCLPISIIVYPKVRPIPDATGNIANSIIVSMKMTCFRG